MSGPGPGVQVTRRGLELTGDSVRSLDEGHDSVVSDLSVCRTRPSTSMSHVVAGTPGGAARPPASRWPMQFVCSHSLLSRSMSRDSS